MLVSPAQTVKAAFIRPHQLHATLHLVGLDAVETIDLLRGRGSNQLWRAGLEVALDNQTAELTEEPCDVHEHELTDGRVRLHSGRSSTLRVDAHHEIQKTLIPQSLALLLAHQFARSGVMVVHGAAFRLGKTGILALGGRGSGKSTVSAAALLAGGEVVSDDWLLLGRAPDGGFVAERLRDFLMLRHGWAGATLRSALSSRGGKLIVGEFKSTMLIDEQSPIIRSRFPQTAEINQIWRLVRPRQGRSTRTILARCNQSEMLASIIFATMPLLYSRHFPFEATALLDTARALIRELPFQNVSGGTDLIASPAEALAEIMVRSGPGTLHPDNHG